ncbi:flagellin N-terminal helical domain-containing protein [Anaerovibrio lipolyticus]|uniref:flagellin N-terminal helical domain-containing protein n=1 Tax=Anaerovibrio lipolyticus TaxID=82374 RepID=UPI001F3515E6|nr:flagellin [Anaerovibrio lipolyticus]
MAMVVKNNMTAINTLNTLNKNSSALSKSLQKVSSGMKINSAADDASGYAISERMRVQIRSLDQANQNTQNGSSMMKVAEGAVSSTVEILKTLKEKAVNAANDSNTDSDRQTIQKELDQSIDQINDNANVTFNGKYLVDGSKNTIGNATYTALSNQSLKEGTTGDTALTDLASRSGDSLEIHSTDKVTVSYVQAGKTHTTTFQVGYKDGNTDKIHTLQDIFNAAEDIDKTNDIFANQANDSVLAAQGIKGTAADTVKGSVKTAMEHKTAEAEAFKASEDEAAQKSVTKASIQTLIDAYNAAGANSAKQITVKADDYGSVTEFTEALKADTSYTGANAGTELTAIQNEVAKMTKSGAWKTANTNYTAADRTALQSKLLTGKTVGLAASNDTVDTASGKDAITVTANTAGIGGQISGFNISISDSKGNVKKSANAALDAFEETIRAQNKSDDNAISLQVGAKANQSIKVGLTDMRAEALGLQGADGTKLNISTQTKANAAINVLDNAIQKALDQQTTIGSVESRLEYTSINLTTASENVQASESTIRDADMAKEMTNYTKNNVLLQAAQSMLAQANQSSSNVLSLLQ